MDKSVPYGPLAQYIAIHGLRVYSYFTSMCAILLGSQNLLQLGAIDFGESLTLKKSIGVSEQLII